jgi:hypothetical protein
LNQTINYLFLEEFQHGYRCKSYCCAGRSHRP